MTAKKRRADQAIESVTRFSPTSPPPACGHRRYLSVMGRAGPDQTLIAQNRQFEPEILHSPPRSFATPAFMPWESSSRELYKVLERSSTAFGSSRPSAKSTVPFTALPTGDFPSLARLAHSCTCSARGAAGPSQHLCSPKSFARWVAGQISATLATTTSANASVRPRCGWHRIQRSG